MGKDWTIKFTVSLFLSFCAFLVARRKQAKEKKNEELFYRTPSHIEAYQNRSNYHNKPIYSHFLIGCSLLLVQSSYSIFSLSMMVVMMILLHDKFYSRSVQERKRRILIISINSVDDKVCNSIFSLHASSDIEQYWHVGLIEMPRLVTDQKFWNGDLLVRMRETTSQTSADTGLWLLIGFELWSKQWQSLLLSSNLFVPGIVKILSRC